MKNIFRKILFGNTPVSEYSTITVKGDVKEKVYLEAGNECVDISADQWLLCLDPVVFGIWLTKEKITIISKKKQEYKMIFTGSGKNSKTVAVITLEYFNNIEEADGTIFLLKMVNTRIRHINFIKTRLLFQRYYKKPGQNFDQLKSYAAAYSYPRRVRVISFKEEDYYNIFPMDLVGEITQSRHYVFGLRHTNVTLARIIETKKMVVSEVPFEFKEIIYQLGKHHSGAPLMAELNFALIQTQQFNFPVPAWANSYKELKIVKTINLGSHMLLWGEVINEKKLIELTGNLYHIHFLHYLHQKRNGLAYPLV